MITIRVDQVRALLGERGRHVPPSEWPTTVAPTTPSSASASAIALAWSSIE